MQQSAKISILGLEPGRVQLASHDPRWAALFQQEKERLSDAIGEFVLDIQHVGSTSIPDIPAKPILDIGVAVHNFEQARVCIQPMLQLGYEYKGEFGIPRRHYFVSGEPRTHHVHMNEIGGKDWETQILFRDYLRAHPVAAGRYAMLKQELAAQFPDDRDAYLDGKAPFIQSTLADAYGWVATLPLDEDRLHYATQVLAGRDPDLARVVERFGLPPLWSRPAGFTTLIHIILEQQVSLASANAAFTRLQAAVSSLTPQAFLKLDDDALRSIGFSRQKTRYGRLLAQALLAGEIDLQSLHHLSDDEARKTLMRVKGIGHWTANIYLMETLLRPDIWPVGDLALANAAREVKGLTERPHANQLESLGEPWRPWRSVAARILWHHYLSIRGMTLD
ncbi:MAG: GrpB family protein [Caldilineales bacterium]|nr:GrpB family protein [Caldilineales bacterium]